MRARHAWSWPFLVLGSSYSVAQTAATGTPTTNAVPMTSSPASSTSVLYSNSSNVAYNGSQTISYGWPNCAGLTALYTFTTPTIASTGSGSAYASQCAFLQNSYSSASNSYNNQYQTVQTTTYSYGGAIPTIRSYYVNATTLCDGYPRVTYSPAILISSSTSYFTIPWSTSTETATVGCGYLGPSPSCSISPSDCDPLWASYNNVVATAAPSLTSILPTPPCLNQSAVSSLSSFNNPITQCGPCTMFGQGVELVYFPVPTTVSRDMCATTPSASLTWYGPDAVITAYAGKSYSGGSPQPGQVTAVAGGHTFTSGTAYISISSVWAENRCNTSYGTMMNDVILAMPSQSVLSLRYSQNHFQYFYITSQQTGYPVSYADFNTQIPWSAWNGQAQCEYVNDVYDCGVIYENDYTPQLAIPPQIRDLQAAWGGCQLWYGGLWDPPLALSKEDSAASATLPSGVGPTTTPASPSSTFASPTPTATALSDTDPTLTSGGGSWPSQGGSGSGQGGGSGSNQGGGSGSNQGGSGSDQGGGSGSNQGGSESGQGGSGSGQGGSDSGQGGSWPQQTHSPWTSPLVVGDRTYTAFASGNAVLINSHTLVNGQGAQTIADGVVASYGDSGIKWQGSSICDLSPPGATHHVTIGDEEFDALQLIPGGLVTMGSLTLTPGGAAATLANGDVINASGSDLIVRWFGTVQDAAQSMTGTGGIAPSTATGRASATPAGATTSSAAQTITSGLPSGTARSSQTTTSGSSRSGANLVTIVAYSMTFFAAVWHVL